MLASCSCPGHRGFTKVAGTCIKVAPHGRMSKTFGEAQAYCKSKYGARLYEPRDVLYAIC